MPSKKTALLPLHKSKKLLASLVLFLVCYFPDYLGTFRNAVGGDSHLQNGANEEMGSTSWKVSPSVPFRPWKCCRKGLPHPRFGASLCKADTALLAPCAWPLASLGAWEWGGELKHKCPGM